jgi:hypothetical protein
MGIEILPIYLLGRFWRTGAEKIIGEYPVEKL